MKKIVIIEDNEIIARLYENKLRAAGNTVHVAYDGVTGLEMIHSVKPNLVLLDLMLPNMSGVEIIRKIRRDHRFTSLPIMAYSGAADDVIAEAVEAGSTTVISKNEASLKEILEQFNELMNLSRNWQIYNQEYFSRESRSDDNGADLSKGEILIVEDDFIMAKLVQDIVKKMGFSPVVINDGQEALKLLAAKANFTAAIFDVELPKIKGTDLLKYMRTEKRLQLIPVMVMTAAADSVRMQLESYDAGATFLFPNLLNDQLLKRF